MATKFMLPRAYPGDDTHVVIVVQGRYYSIQRGVEYVVRKKGKWLHLGHMGYNCSNCGALNDIESNFCPACGDDMRTTYNRKKRSANSSGPA